MKLIEKLAELEHEQWVHWNKSLPKDLQKPELWIPYEELTEEQKDKDRYFARKVILMLAEFFLFLNKEYKQ